VIDGFTLYFKGAVAQRIRQLPFINNWKVVVIMVDGAVEFEHASYDCSNGCKIHFECNSMGNIKVMLNLGKFYLGNNYQNLPYTQLQPALEQLFDLLKCHYWEVSNFMFEFGVVTTLEYNPDELLNNMMVNRRQLFEPRTKDGIYSRNFEQNQFRFKNYNKSKEAKLVEQPNIFRSEVHLLKKQVIAATGINKVQDLMEKPKLLLLKDFHCDKMATSLIHDWRVPITQLNNAELRAYYQWSQMNFWQEIIKNPNRYKHQKKLAQAFYQKHNNRNIAEELAMQLENEWNECINS
jgi:hypothetical protein